MSINDILALIGYVLSASLAGALVSAATTNEASHKVGGIRFFRFGPWTLSLSRRKGA